MKIWHVGAAPNPLRVDGVSRTVWLMSVEQARLGHDVSLILDSAPAPEAMELAATVGLKLHDTNAGTFSYTKQMAELVRTIPTQVVHMHSVFIPRQAALARLLREHGIPYLITPHAGLAPQVLARGRLKKSIYSTLRERPRFMGSAAIALVTPAEENAIRAYVPEYEGIVRWMPNPVDFSVLDPHRWQGIKDPKRLVFLGRFDVLVKGIDILVEIARLMPEVTVDLYGIEDPKTLSWLNKLRENLPPNVTFRDPIFGPAKAELLSRASIYIQPSRWEGFPVSVAECLYLGVPSSIADTLDLAQLFHQHDLGLVLSLKPDLAAAQLRAALSDTNRLNDWSRRGREFAIKHFAPAAVAENHVRLYEEIIDKQQRVVTQLAHATDGNGHPHPVAHEAPARAAARVRRLIPAHFRGALKQNVARLMERSSDMLGPTDSPRAVVLCYHSISDVEHGLTVAPADFRKHLVSLRQMGYNFMTFGDFIADVMRWGLCHKNTAVITFDDGFEDNFTQAAPILAELGIPATFFVTTGLMQRDQDVIDSFNRLVRFDSGFVSPRQLAQMHAAGMEIGAHTHTHPNLLRQRSSEARFEIAHSKRLLEEAIGARVRSFAYPFGKRHIHYSTSTADLVRESGYAGAGAVAFRAVSSRKSVRIFEIPRFFITRGDSPAQFKQKIVGHFDWLGAIQEVSPRWMKSMVSPEDRY